MDTNIVGWIEIYVADMERAKSFYGNVFQKGDWMDLSQEGIEMFAFPWDDKVGGASGALVKMADHQPSNQGTIVYFNCADCAIEESRVEEHGGKVQQKKMSIGEFGYISMIHDTEGNMIGLHSKE